MSHAKGYSLATVVAVGNRPRCGAHFDFSGSGLQTTQEHYGGPRPHLHPREKADRTGGAGRETAQGTCLGKTEKVEVPGQS